MFNSNLMKEIKSLITSTQPMKNEEISIIKYGDKYKELFIPTYLRRNKINIGKNNWKTYDESMRLIRANMK